MNSEQQATQLWPDLRLCTASTTSKQSQHCSGHCGSTLSSHASAQASTHAPGPSSCTNVLMGGVLHHLGQNAVTQQAASLSTAQAPRMVLATVDGKGFRRICEKEPWTDPWELRYYEDQVCNVPDRTVPKVLQKEANDGAHRQANACKSAWDPWEDAQEEAFASSRYGYGTTASVSSIGDRKVAEEVPWNDPWDETPRTVQVQTEATARAGHNDCQKVTVQVVDSKSRLVYTNAFFPSQNVHALRRDFERATGLEDWMYSLESKYGELYFKTWGDFTIDSFRPENGKVVLRANCRGMRS